MILYYLERTGENRIVTNPNKFQFTQKEIELADFQVISNDIKPLPKLLERKPRCIQDMRTWFGLVNQVSHYGQITGLKAPFKSLLSPITQLLWTKDLDDAFGRK